MVGTRFIFSLPLLSLAVVQDVVHSVFVSLAVVISISMPLLPLPTLTPTPLFIFPPQPP